MQRDKSIDTLRGFAMLLMIVTHVTAWYRASRTADFIWDFSHFSVPIFLFCSLYLMTRRPVQMTLKTYFGYVVKRLKRLLIPYYIYLFVFLFMQWTLGGKKMTLEYILNSLFPWGGPDSSWLVTLFVYLTVFAPIIFYLYQKARALSLAIFLVSLGSTIYFLFESYANYREIMWLPWMTIIYFTLFFTDYLGKSQKRIVVGALGFFILFLGLRVYLDSMDKNLIIFNNKYPPNLYYLSYGLFGLLATYWASTKKLFEKLKVDGIIHFFSIYSYPLYFIHNLVIYTLDKLNVRFGYWPVFFLVVAGTSALIQTGLNRISKAKS